MNGTRALVLLVDDEPSLSEALAVTLESRGFESLRATDMTAGVTALECHPIDVLVTDIMMPAGERFPNVDSTEVGFAFIEYVHAHWPRLPIVCLSVIADGGRVRTLKRRGVRFLRKGETPLSTAVEVITAVASGRRPRW
jgi:DNA-binding NarL/FixJ family response regulator